MNIKVNFDNFNVKEVNKDNKIKILMLKGEKGDSVSAEWGTITGTLSEQTDLQAALNLKANLTDIETINEQIEGLDTNKAEVSEVYTKTETEDLINNAGFLVENDLQMVSTTDIENGSQLTDATGYSRLNKINGDTIQDGTPTQDNPVDIEVVTGDIDVTVSNNDNTISQSFTISLGTLELCKLGDYQDYIYKENDKWYLHKEINKIILDGSENWASPTTNVFYSQTILTNPKVPTNTRSMYSNYFIYGGASSSSASMAIGKFYSWGNSLPYRLNFASDKANNVEDFKTWLSTHNVIVYYQYETPTITEITDGFLINQLNNIYNVILYENETNFSITADDLLPTLNITYSITNRDIYSKEEVDDIILNANRDNDRCEYIFPGKWGLSGSGNSSLIKVANKVLLFDTNSTTVYDYLKSMFLENNITHLDYVIISHFDSDHRGNLLSLINDGYIDSNTKYIHPDCITEIYGQAIKNWYDGIENLCIEKEIESIVPTENQVINVTDNFSMRFGNLDKEYSLENYTTNNELSMIVECKHNDFYSLFMGDALTKTEKYLVDTNFIKNEIGLYNIPHHSIEHNCYLPFYDLIKPKFAVAQAQMAHFNIGIFSYNQSGAILFEKGCTNYYSFNNTDNIKFVEYDNTINCVKGIPLTHSGNSLQPQFVYCDSVNYNENRQDGSEEYPFKDLIQALGIVSDYNNKPIIIRLKAGTYGTSYTGSVTPSNNTCQILNRKNYIMIIGYENNVVINKGFVISNCSNVRLENLSIKPSDENYCCDIRSSNVYIRNCNFIGEESETLAGSGIFANTQSIVTALNCEFSYFRDAYLIRSVAKVYSANDTVNNVTNIVNTENGVSSELGNLNSNTDFSTITNLDNYSSDRHIHSKPEKYSYSVNTTMTGDINLPIGFSNIYNYLILNYECRLNSATAGRGRKIIPYNAVNSLLLNDINARDNTTIINYTTVITLLDKKITILRNTTIITASDGTLTKYEPSDASDDSYGLKITSIDFI